MLTMYSEENLNIMMFTNMSKNQKMTPWKWFFVLWLGSLSFTAFIAYSLKLFLKWIS